MSKPKPSKAKRLAREARRRITDAGRLATVRVEDLTARVAAVMAQVRELRAEGIRRALAEASARHAAQELLRAAFAPEHDYGWRPWGYETQELPIVRPTVPQLRLIISQGTAQMRTLLSERRLVLAA